MTLELHERLGIGGSAEVYRATWQEGNAAHEGAVKTTSRAAAEWEADWYARVVHPSLPACFGVREWPTGGALLLEAIDGWSLGDLLSRGPAPEAAVWQVVAVLLEVVDAAAEQGCVHGDLKPDNVRIDSAGQVRLLDPGPAGTQGFIAPEGNGTALADRYAVGALAFELLAGTPFGPAGRRAPAHAHRVRAALRSVPEASRDGVSRLLSWAPDERMGRLPAGEPGALCAWAGVEAAPEARRWRRVSLWAVAGVVVGLGGLLASLPGETNPSVAPTRLPAVSVLEVGSVDRVVRVEAQPAVYPSSVTPARSELQEADVPTVWVQLSGAERAVVDVDGVAMALPAQIPVGRHPYQVVFSRGQVLRGTLDAREPRMVVCDAGFKTCDVR